MATIGAGNDEGRLRALPSAVTVDSRGRLYVTTPDVDELPYVYDRTGRLLRRLGRRGAGPGEYQNPSAVVVLPGDTLVVVDQSNARLTWLSPEYDVVRTAPGPGWVWSAAALPNGEIVVNARVADAARIGLPLHRFDRVGNYEGSFGAVDPLLHPTEYTANARWLASSKTGGVWSVPFTHRYAVERWDTAGERAQQFVREVEWFQSYQRFWFPAPDRPPPPLVQSVWEDDQGRLWLIAWRPDAEWRRGLKQGPVSEGQATYEYVSYDRVYDSVIEVFDVKAAQLIASRTYDDTYLRFVGGALVAKVRQHPDGWFEIDVSSFNLVRPPGR